MMAETGGCRASASGSFTKRGKKKAAEETMFFRSFRDFMDIGLLFVIFFSFRMEEIGGFLFNDSLDDV